MPPTAEQRLYDALTPDTVTRQLDFLDKSIAAINNLTNFLKLPGRNLPVLSHCRKSTTGRQPDNLVFQGIGGHYIYSAYYDDRLDTRPASVRVIALLKSAERPTFYCHFKTNDDVAADDWPARDKIQPMKNKKQQYLKNSPPMKNKRAKSRDSHPPSYYFVQATAYEMCENHNKDYGGWILSCRMDASLERIPCHVHLSLERNAMHENKTSVRVPLFRLNDDFQRRNDFGICVPPLFGHIPSTTLVEFIEFSKLLGVSHFIFYRHKVSREISKTLLFYEMKGLVTVVRWDVPVDDQSVWYHGQLLAINDCLYRSMHAFDHVAFNDIDEFIVPHAHKNWKDMVSSFSTKVPSGAAPAGSNPCGYSFQSAFFDPLLPGLLSHVLYDLESDLRTKSFSKVRSKVMVKPVEIFELGIHHISRPLMENRTILAVPTEVAFVHHYRKCIKDFDPNISCQIYTSDESLTRFIPTLRHNIHQTLWRLKEDDKILNEIL